MLTVKQIEDLFQLLTMQLLGIPAIDLKTQKPINQDKVRVSWPAQGSPGWKITEDITFIQVTTANDAYIQQRNIAYEQNSEGLSRTTAYTRVHTVQWIVYGPDSYENAESIRNGIYLPEIKRILATSNLYLVLDVPPVYRSPELFNGQWWQRSDISARFNEAIIQSVKQPYLEGINIVIKSDTGQEREVN